MSELEEAIGFYKKQKKFQFSLSDKKEEISSVIYNEILNQLIREKLTDHEIRRVGIRVSEEEIENVIERIRLAERFDNLNCLLKRDSLTIDQFKEDVLNQILRAKIVQLKVNSRIIITDDDIKGYYDNHQELYGGRNIYHLSNILLKVVTEKKCNFDEFIYMNEIVEKLDSGFLFDTIVEDFNTCGHAVNGSYAGYIGTFVEDDLDDKVRDAVIGLKVGEHTNVITTDLGLQIFYVKNITKTGSIPLKSLRDTIYNKLFEKEVEMEFMIWIKSLRNNSYIKIIN